MSVRILIGDMRDRLKELPDNSVDSCVCDPPYHLTSIVKRFGAENAAPAKVGATGAYARASKGFMGQMWDGGDVAFQPETWSEVLRVLKPGGHLIAFSGTRTYHRMVCAIEDAGFEIRDQLAWVYGSGFPKSHDISKQIDRAAGAEREVLGVRRYADGTEGHWGASDKFAQDAHTKSLTAGTPKLETAPATDSAREWQGWGTALKPSWEPICLARKPISEKNIAANVLKWGAGALNIDGCRIVADDGEDRSRPPRTPNGILGGGKGTNLTASEHNAQGRWPANLCHDGSDEVLAGFPETESGTGAVKRSSAAENEGNQGAAYGAESRPAGTPMVEYGDKGSAARFFYCAKPATDERGDGNNHPTVKPVSLMRWLVRMVTPKGGTVLDPFMGSGSTGLAAQAEQFAFIGCELSPQYAAIAERRMRDDAGLFASVEIVQPALPDQGSEAA